MHNAATLLLSVLDSSPAAYCEATLSWPEFSLLLTASPDCSNPLSCRSSDKPQPRGQPVQRAHVDYTGGPAFALEACSFDHCGLIRSAAAHTDHGSACWHAPCPNSHLLSPLRVSLCAALISTPLLLGAAVNSGPKRMADVTGDEWEKLSKTPYAVIQVCMQ